MTHFETAGSDNALPVQDPRAAAESDLPPVPHGLAAVGRRLLRRPELSGLASALLVFAFFALIANHGFLSEIGVASWLGSSAEFGIVAIPVGLLMIGGEFDLSVGAIAGASSITVGICSFKGLPLLAGVGLAFVVGTLIGLVNGIIVTRTRLPSFIVTLSTMFVVAGAGLAVALSFANSSTITVPPPGLYDPTLTVVHDVFASSWHQFNVSILWCTGLALGASHLMSRSRYGNWILATGGGARIARGLGVRTARVKVALFMSVGAGGALLGVIQTLEYNTSDVNTGSSFIFIGIAACVVGGILLTGGYGSILGAILGSVTYGIVEAGVQYLGWNSNLSELFIGIFLLTAVLANNYLRRLSSGLAEAP